MTSYHLLPAPSPPPRPPVVADGVAVDRIYLGKIRCKRRFWRKSSLPSGHEAIASALTAKGKRTPALLPPPHLLRLYEIGPVGMEP